MLYIWKTKVCFFKQNLFLVIFRFKQKFVTYNNGFMKS